MGQKCAKLSEEAVRACEEFVRKLSSLGEVSSRKMFGGYGIFESGAMFALITSKGSIHLKTDETNRYRFEDAGTTQHGKMPYFEVPQEVLVNDKKLQEWAKESIAIAHAAKSKKK